MEIHFLGGAGEVGRSGILIKDKNNLLLDYGIKLDEKIEYPQLPASVDACVISHAHLDHSGFAPALYNHLLPVAFGTEPTLKLSKMLIEDSIKLNKRNKVKPRFFKKQLIKFMNKYISHEYKSNIDFKNYNITLHNAGHICGSAITRLEKVSTGKVLTYTGDFKLSPQVLQEGAEVVQTDVLITETTYATREHPDREQLIKSFIEDIKKVLDAHGTALLPVFAVGRAQEILAILYQHNLIGNVYLDGMAKKATETVLKYPEFIRNSNILEKAAKKVIWADSYERNVALEGNSIVLTTAGMLNGGPVLNYIPRLNATSKILLTGYQVEGTNGRKLLDNKPIDIDGQKYKIRTPVSFYDFSAHASKTDLHEYVKKSNPETVICVHGDPENSKAFAESLKLEGFAAFAPKTGERINLEF